MICQSTHHIFKHNEKEHIPGKHDSLRLTLRSRPCSELGMSPEKPFHEGVSFQRQFQVHVVPAFDRIHYDMSRRQDSQRQCGDIYNGEEIRMLSPKGQ